MCDCNEVIIKEQLEFIKDEEEKIREAEEIKREIENKLKSQDLLDEILDPEHEDNLKTIDDEIIKAKFGIWLRRLAIGILE
jgi:hypothetical protein